MIKNKGNPIKGREKVALAFSDMPGLRNLLKKFQNKKLFRDVNIIGCVTLTPETGAFILTLKRLGANLRWCSDNQFASDDDIIAYLKKERLSIFASSNMSNKEYFECMKKAIEFPKNVSNIQIIDDGGDLTMYLVKNNPKFLNKVKGISEQTTCGINNIKKLYKSKILSVPTIDVNNCFIKKNFDNYYGVRESLISALINATGKQIAAKKITVFGYGPVGKGAADILRKFGARVSIVEINILRLMQALFDGFEPTDLKSAVKNSDICITATGCIDVIPSKSILNAKNGLILCNIGHGTKEYDVAFLEKRGKKKRINDFLDEYTLSGKKIYSMCKGALANFIAASANPPSIMSLTFTLQLLAQLEFVKYPEKYKESKFYNLDENIEKFTAELNFPDLKNKLSILNKTQKEYLC